MVRVFLTAFGVAGNGGLRLLAGAEVRGSGRYAGVGMIAAGRETSGSGGLGVASVAVGTAGSSSSSVGSITGLPLVGSVASWEVARGADGAGGAGGAGRGIWFVCCCC